MNKFLVLPTQIQLGSEIFKKYTALHEWTKYGYGILR
jgi:hypothetical protein